MGFHKRTTTQIVELDPRINKDSMRSIYRTIYNLRNEIVTDNIGPMNRLKLIYAKDVRPRQHIPNALEQYLRGENGYVVERAEFNSYQINSKA